MAGDIKRQRKSWTLQDRSKVSINILRANLAEEGDEEAQLEVAKRLLQETSDPGVPERAKNENARLALYWLIKSSEQGNDEATQLLKECLQSGRGLTAQNLLDVRGCVTTPRDEKLTFKAARVLHRKLSNGEEFITTAQLLARVNVKRKNVTFDETNGILHREIFPDEDNVEEQQVQQQDEEKLESPTSSSQSTPTEGVDAMKNVNLNETFTVAPSHAQAVSSSTPATGSRLSKREPNSRSIENSFSKFQPHISGESQTDLRFAMTQPGKKLTLNDLLRAAKDFNLGRIPQVSIDERKRILSRHKWDSISFPNLFLLQLFVLGVMGNVMQPAEALTYLLYVGIICSAYNCFVWKLRYDNFQDWKSAYDSVLKAGDWNTENIERKFSQRYLLPYLIVIMIGYAINVLTLDNMNSLSPVMLGVVAMMSINFGALRRVLPSWQQIAIASLSLIYYKSPSALNILGERNLVSEKMQVLHQPMISNGIYVQYSPSVFSFAIFLILMTTVKSSLHRIISKTLPEVVFSLWLIKVTESSVQVKNDVLVSWLCAGVLVCGVICLLCSTWKTWKVMLLLVFGILLIILSGLAAANWYHTMSNVGHQELLEDASVEYLEWEEYDATCHRKAWNVQNPAATQIKCSSLYDDPHRPTLVKWKGRISIVKVEKLSRSPGGSSLESVVFDISVGILSPHKDDGQRNWQSFLPGSTDGETVAPASLIVKTDELQDKSRKQFLVDHVLNFRTGDKIEFVGKLKGSTVGSLKPHIIEVQTLQCLSCATADYGEFVISKERSLNCASLFRVLWSGAFNSSFVHKLKICVNSFFSELRSTYYRL